MQDIKGDIASFRAARERFAERAKQTAALQILCGLDLSEVAARTGESREKAIRTIRRAMERERLKGARGQAGYDLDRHIALRRSLERLGAARPPKHKSGVPDRKARPGRRASRWEAKSARHRTG